MALLLNSAFDLLVNYLPTPMHLLLFSQRSYRRARGVLETESVQYIQEIKSVQELYHVALVLDQRKRNREDGC